MSVLSYESLRALCAKSPPLIEDCIDANFQASSYDISIGGQCYLYNLKKKKVKEMIFQLDEDENIVIPPNELCFIISKESINMPNNLVGHISLKTDLIRKGVMLAAQPPVDPGYQGKIYGMLYNFSNDRVCLFRKDTILTIEFAELDSPTTFPTSEHHMQHFDDLAKLIKDPPIESSLDHVRRLYESSRSKFERAIPTLLTIVTILVAILAILFTIFTFLKR